MRISDWSSGVGSSDLLDNQRAGRARRDAARLDDGPVDQQRRAFRQPVDRYRVATIAKQDGAAGGQGHGPAGPNLALRKMNVISEARRVGHESVSTCRSRRLPFY